MADSVKTLCPYCGVGCGLEVLPPPPTQGEGQPAVGKIVGDRAHPSSQGLVCVKGATIGEALNKDRLLYPMGRDSLAAPFRRLSWEEALTLLTSRLQEVRRTQGPAAICLYGSGQFQTEDYYVAQKLMKGFLGSNNFDTNSRLCMASAVVGYRQSFGSDGPPCCYEDLELTDCAFLIGTNAAECHPIAFNRLHKHLKRDPKARLIVADPRRTKTAEAADLYLPIKPGTDIDLLHGIAYLLLQWECWDRDFIEQHTQGFPAYAAVVRHYPPELVARRCGLTTAQLEQAARYWQESERVLSLWAMGLNQSAEGTAKVRALIDLHLLTGNLGKPGAGPFSLTGQPNAMGGREVGGFSHGLPGYRSVKDPQQRAEVEEFWGLPAGTIAPTPGRDVWRMMEGLAAGEVGVLWIAATNPAVSLPDLNRAHSALRQSPFTVYQDAYYPTETAAYAHLLLPAAQWGEKTGTMTNSERVVTLCPQFQPPPGEGRADWEIFAEVGRRLGFEEAFAFPNAAAVYREFVQLTRGRLCDMTGISHERLQQEGPLQWPCPLEAGEGRQQQCGKRLYLDRKFATPDGKARFSAYYSQGLAEPPDEEYPFVLTVGRLYGHWHTQTRTGRIEKINKLHPQPFLEIHPQDAEKLGITGGCLVEVKSRRGVARFPALVTTAISPGTVFAPLHWGALWAEGAEANALTHPQACPDSRQPELKACAVRLSQVAVQ